MVIKREVVMNKKSTGCIKLGQNDANDLFKLIAFLKENSPSLQFWGETDEVWRLRLIAPLERDKLKNRNKPKNKYNLKFDDDPKMKTTIKF